MMRMVRTTLFLAAGLPGALGAQAVGSLPTESPFRDLEYRHDWSVLVGPSFGGKDGLNVAPHGGLSIASRYDLRLGRSPVLFTSRLGYIGAERRIVRQQAPVAQREAGSEGQPLYLADVGFTLNLTGNKSWRSLVPSVGGGVGLMSDFRGIRDSSDFQFGSRFSIVMGLGVKYVPRNSPWTVRAELTNYFYSVPYPGAFNTVPPNSTLEPLTTRRNDWVRNSLLLVGINRQLFR
jgi:hypothetical protein